MVACKLVPRGSKEYVLEMAKREFSMLAQLGPSHLNIVRPLEIVLTSKHLVLITEYVPGMFHMPAPHALQQHGSCCQPLGGPQEAAVAGCQ
jgi:hypothetical protein